MHKKYITIKAPDAHSKDLNYIFISKGMAGLCGDSVNSSTRLRFL